jgi:hypothetical protein
MYLKLALVRLATRALPEAQALHDANARLESTAELEADIFRAGGGTNADLDRFDAKTAPDRAAVAQATAALETLFDQFAQTGGNLLTHTFDECLRAYAKLPGGLPTLLYLDDKRDAADAYKSEIAQIVSDEQNEVGFCTIADAVAGTEEVRWAGEAEKLATAGAELGKWAATNVAEHTTGLRLSPCSIEFGWRESLNAIDANDEYRKALDPPDENYRQVARPVRIADVRFVTHGRARAAARAWTALNENSARQAVTDAALVTSLERLQGLSLLRPPRTSDARRGPPASAH